MANELLKVGEFEEKCPTLEDAIHILRPPNLDLYTAARIPFYKGTLTAAGKWSHRKFPESLYR